MTIEEAVIVSDEIAGIFNDLIVAENNGEFLSDEGKEEIMAIFMPVLEAMQDFVRVFHEVNADLRRDEPPPALTEAMNNVIDALASWKAGDAAA